jgi:hypothetical protein
LSFFAISAISPLEPGADPMGSLVCASAETMNK